VYIVAATSVADFGPWRTPKPAQAERRKRTMANAENGQAERRKR
jgi:hypothetical protein